MADQLSLTFAALADPTRRALLAHLGEVPEATVNELAEPFDMSLPAISKHLKVLERAGLITRTRDGVRRPSQLAPQPLREANIWIEAYRERWEQQLGRLDDYLTELQKTSATKKGKKS